MSVKREPRILAIDAGGTMTDTFIIDAAGDFVVGKAQTTPEDESEGFLNSSNDALSYWKTAVPEAFPSLVTGIYSGTTILNKLLQRQGRRVGVLVSQGQEDYFRLEMAEQTYLGYSYADRLHVVTHQHNEPLVPRTLVRGVPERVDTFGDIAIPLNEDAARRAVAELLDEGVESICVNLLFCYRNPAHEYLVRTLAEEVMREKGVEVPVYLASDYYPIRGDFPRLNTLVVEAFVAEPSRRQMKLIDGRVKEQGAHFDLRIMASHGGTISYEAKELARTLISGPIGGVIGARWLADKVGLENVFCADIGGTSLDLAIITGGEYDVKPYPDIARTLLAIPLVETDSVGAGTGSYVRINPSSNRIEIGPDSAGCRIGTCWLEGGTEVVTVTDCNVVLGLLNPDYFLVGDILLDRETACRNVEEQIARPLNIGVYEAAAGVVELFEESLKNEVLARILGKGYAPANYTLLCYGGGGPLHVSGIAGGLHFERVLIPSWAAGFSAFGCACSDFEYRFDASIDLPVLPGMPPEVYEGVAAMINARVAGLREKVIEEFAKSGFAENDIKFCVYLRMQYLGQLRDLEVKTDKEWIDGASGIQDLIDNFEELYGKVYARAAKSPELGYLLPMVIVSGTVDVEKPSLPSERLSGEEPPASAAKGERDVYWKNGWLKASVWEMGEMAAGNRVDGPAIIESPSTTLVVPPGASAHLDQHMIFHLELERGGGAGTEKPGREYEGVKA